MQVTRYGGGLKKEGHAGYKVWRRSKEWWTLCFVYKCQTKSGGHRVLCTSVKQRVVGDIVFCVEASNMGQFEVGVKTQNYYDGCQW